MLFFIVNATILKVTREQIVNSYLLVIQLYDPNCRYLYKLTDKFFEDNILSKLEEFVDSGYHEICEKYFIPWSGEEPYNINGNLYTVVADL